MNIILADKVSSLRHYSFIRNRFSIKCNLKYTAGSNQKKKRYLKTDCTIKLGNNIDAGSVEPRTISVTLIDSCKSL